MASRCSSENAASEELGQLPFDLGIIEVRLEWAELLLSALGKRDVDARQVYRFPPRR